MAYIYPAPGVTGSEVTLSLTNSADIGSVALDIAGLQDMTINSSNDIFTWEQLDSGSKLQIATTSTNSIATNLVVDQAAFFGSVAQGSQTSTDTAAELGIWGMSRLKSQVDFTIFLGKTDDGSAGKTISGSGYITGLAPAVSAGEPVWVTPITITVTGDYTVGT